MGVCRVCSGGSDHALCHSPGVHSEPLDLRPGIYLAAVASCLTSIRCGKAAAEMGAVISSTPLRYSAEILSSSTPSGSAMSRWNLSVRPFAINDVGIVTFVRGLVVPTDRENMTMRLNVDVFCVDSRQSNSAMELLVIPINIGIHGWNGIC